MSHPARNLRDAGPFERVSACAYVIDPQPTRT